MSSVSIPERVLEALKRVGVVRINTKSARFNP